MTTKSIQLDLPQSKDFRLFLQEELLRRCRKNSSYSVRAFAKALQCDFSTLSKILRGARPVGSRTITRLGARLGLNPDQIREFVAVQVKPTKEKPEPATGATVGPDYQQLTLDSFQIISDWYHYGILELMKLKSFDSNPRWIAKTLGISQNEAKIAIERLERVGILEITKDGKWIDHSGGRSTTIGNTFSSAAFRNLQRQILEGALKALEEVPMERRDQSSMTIAVHSSRLPEAKERIKKFRREMSDLLTHGIGPDEVYQLGVSLYPVTDLRNEERKMERKK